MALDEAAVTALVEAIDAAVTAPTFALLPGGKIKGKWSAPARWQETTGHVADPAAVVEDGGAVGMVCGHEFDVIDIDPRNGGDLDDLQKGGLIPPVRRMVRTPSGGRHLYIDSLGLPKGVLTKGVDYQGARSFVFAPPTAGYTDVPEDEWPAPTPGAEGALRARLGRQKTEPEAGQGEARPTMWVDDLDAYLAAALEREVRDLSLTHEGDRDNQLNRSAFALGQLIDAGLDEDEVRERLTEAAREIGQPDVDIRRALRSGLEAGKENPRDVREGTGPGATSGAWPLIDVARALAGDLKPPEPTLLRRSDGSCLLYPGRTHSLAGEPGSGKSWLAQHAAAEILCDGGRVFYIDYESNPGEVLSRLRSLGCPDDAMVAGLDYVHPEGPPKGDEFDALLGRRYDLVVIDGVTRALTLSGLTGDNLSNDNEAVTKWNQLFPERFAAETGAAVLMVDHVTKASDSRGGYAIGAQSKLATITGAAYIAVKREPFNREQSGSFDVYVSKDRAGGVSGGDVTATGRHVCRVYVDSSEDDAISLDLRASTRPTEDEAREGYRVRVAAFLATLPDDHEGAATNTVKREVEGNAAAVLAALRDLVSSGYVQQRARGQALLHRLVKPYVPMFEEVEDL